MKINKIIVCSSAIAAVLTLSASTTQAQTLVNGSFENAGGFTANPVTAAGVDQGWATFGAARSDMSSAESFPELGSYGLLVQNGPGNNWNPQGTYQIVSGVIANTSYTFSAYWLHDGLSANTGTYNTPVALQIGFGNFVGGVWTLVGASTTWGFGDGGSTHGNDPAIDTWYQGSVTATAPAGAADAQVYIFYMDNGQTTVDQLYFDNASLTATPAPEPSTLALAGIGGAALLALIRRRKN
jgi:hypothetical protein